MQEYQYVVPVGLFPKLMTLMFIYMKLTDKIDWSWFCVIMPMIVFIVLSAIQKAIKKTKEDLEKQNE